MMDWSETVLLLRVGTLREADCWVRFFSPTQGMLTAFAFGGRRSRRRFGGCLDPLDRVHFSMAWERRRRYLVLREGALVERFGRMKADLDRLGMASNCLRFVEGLCIPPDGAAVVSHALVEALRLLDGERGVSRFFPVLFRAHVIFTMGFAPKLDACGSCGADPGGRPAFSIPKGTVLCRRCAGAERSISPATIALLRSIAQPLPAPWALEQLPPVVREETWYLVDHFLRWHVDLHAGTHGARC